MSTFSKLRVGAKPYDAGSPKLILVIDTTTLGVVATLPPGAIVLGANADAVTEATVSDGTTTATLTMALADTPVASDIRTTIAGPGAVEVTTALAGLMEIEYIIADPKDGANK